MVTSSATTGSKSRRPDVKEAEKEGKESERKARSSIMQTLAWRHISSEDT